MRNKISEQRFSSRASLPNFFIDHIENRQTPAYDYCLNMAYSNSNLESFYSGNDICLLRPGIDNNLLLCKPELPDEEITLQWRCPDPILDLQSMNSTTSNSFLVRGKNTICLMEIGEEFGIEVSTKFNCNKGYLDSAFNYMKKSELACINKKYKLRVIDLETKKIGCCYTLKDVGVVHEPRVTKINYVKDNVLMMMTDKVIRIIDTRCKTPVEDVEVSLSNCDIMLNFTSDKSYDYVSEVYLATKHRYYIFDTRMRNLDGFIHHNLGYPPCFVNYFKENEIQLVTLSTQSEQDRVIFGSSSPYSLPYRLSNLQDTLNRCRSTEDVPVIPTIERLNFPITGVQMVFNSGDVSLYYSNIFGELFQQDILIKNRCSDKPVRRMYDWLMEIYETYNPELNVVHFADASAVFNIETDFNEVDLFTGFEKSKLNLFLNDSHFDLSQLKAEPVTELWNDGTEDDVKFLLESDPKINKVEEWMENAKFEMDLDNESRGAFSFN